MDGEEKYWVVEKEEGRGVVERNIGEKGGIKENIEGSGPLSYLILGGKVFPYPLIGYLSLTQSDHQSVHQIQH